MMTWLAIKAINFYQKYISPYKGFNCAHRVATGETSCSGYGKKVIKRFGLVIGMKLLNRRFYDCSWHAKQLKKLRDAQKPITTQYKAYRPVGGYRHSQAGFVDCDCPSGCDLPSCDVPSCHMPSMSSCTPDCSCNPAKALSALDCLDCMPDSCDFNKKNTSTQFQEKRNQRNENMYGESASEKNPVSLSKENDDGDSD